MLISISIQNTRILLILALFTLSNCTNQEIKPEYTTLQGEAQGTTFSIKYQDKNQNDFSNAVDSLFRLMDHSMSVWDKNSIVTAVNNNTAMEVDEHFKRVFFAGKDVHKNTDGLFDMTVGPLVRRWGFSFKKNQTPPDEKEVEQLLKGIGMEKVNIEGNQFKKENPNTEIDFNAIAQGYTVDLIGDFLQKNGVENYMVEVGGEVKAQGINERGQAWHIGIDQPTNEDTEGRPLQCIVPLRNRALATSGSYRKFVERDGQKYSHAINPKTGQPVEHNLLSVSVLAPSCMSADAYATAFLVMGLEETKIRAKELGLEVYCIFEKEDKALEVWRSGGFLVVE